MRKIVEGIKDDSGAYIKAEPSAPVTKPKKVKVTDTDLDELLRKSLFILQRETTNLMIESSGGKLSRDHSTCLRDNIKLLIELKAKEKELLDNLDEDDLKDILDSV